jgi:uroporphyrin-III C-methyltransferase/precorrin-2 dehydrogenase/sirohydrochlorin ferrochelatase
VNRSPLVIGISTDGAAPALAQALRVRIETMAPRGLKRWAEAAKAWRATIQAAGASAEVRRRLWQTFAAMAFEEADEAPATTDLAELMRLVEKDGADVSEGKLAIVRVGDGKVGSLTLDAVRALQSADVIVHDDLTSGAILELSRREAKTIQISKQAGNNTESLVSTLVAEGQRVVRLVS